MKNIKELIKDKTKNRKPVSKTIINEKFVLDKSGSVLLDYIILISEDVKVTTSISKKLDLIAEQNTYLGALTKLAYI